MTKVCWIGTRKGLLKVQQSEAGIWSLSAPDFTGEPVTMVLPQNGSGSMYVALNLGHFGPKLHPPTTPVFPGKSVRRLDSQN
ncbi:MAG: hypothetical protein IIC60_15040 [Proteobacteria bacterium]|nr:hypothetical protein [Pseudomonadota bacterium]